MYTCVHIRRPLQSVERVRLHLLAYNIQPFPSPEPSKQSPERTSVQPAQVARQLESRNPTLRAPRQVESRISVVRMLESWDLIISSSSIGDLLGCNSLPQAGRGSGPRCPRLPQAGQGSGQKASKSPQIGAPAHQASKKTSIQASIPQVLEVGGRGGSLFNIYIYIYMYMYIYRERDSEIHIYLYIYI